MARLVIDYNPTTEQMKKQLRKALVQGERLKWSAIADAEIERKMPVLEQMIQDAIDSGDPLTLNMAQFISDVALEAIEAGDDDEDNE